jgi:hypothetical protein
MVRMRLSSVWRGHGSAIFLEFGTLERREGRQHHTGEITAMIPFDWRIERGDTIVCGSGSDEVIWQPTFEDMIGTTVHGVSTFRRLPELYIALSGGYFVASLMTAEGDPDWALIDRRKQDRLPTILVLNQRIVTEARRV